MKGAKRCQAQWHKQSIGGGPHLCIGNSFAMMEVQLLLATIAQQCQLRLAPDHLIALQALVSLRPKSGLTITIHKREWIS